MTDPQFGARLRRLVYETGLSVREFALFCDISEYSLRSYMSGRSEPRLDRLRKIKAVLGCTWHDLLG